MYVSEGFDVMIFRMRFIGMREFDLVALCLIGFGLTLFDLTLVDLLAGLALASPPRRSRRSRNREHERSRHRGRAACCGRRAAYRREYRRNHTPWPARGAAVSAREPRDSASVAATARASGPRRDADDTSAEQPTTARGIPAAHFTPLPLHARTQGLVQGPRADSSSSLESRHACHDGRAAPDRARPRHSRKWRLKVPLPEFARFS